MLILVGLLPFMCVTDCGLGLFSVVFSLCILKERWFISLRLVVHAKTFKLLPCECMDIQTCVHLIEEDCSSIDLVTYLRMCWFVLLHCKKQF